MRVRETTRRLWEEDSDIGTGIIRKDNMAIARKKINVNISEICVSRGGDEVCCDLLVCEAMQKGKSKRKKSE